MFVDLVFPALGDSIPTDHAYALYSALSRAVPAFHDPQGGLRFAPIAGVPGTPGRLNLLTGVSHLRVRTTGDAIPRALPLGGKAVEVAGAAVRLGPPTVHPLVPAAALESRLVTFKHGEEPEAFLAAAKAKLAELEVAGEPAIRVFDAGPRKGEFRRRVLRVRGRAIVGYAVAVSGLSADESVRLQEHGLGGRTRMGCGFFLPAREGV